MRSSLIFKMAAFLFFLLLVTASLISYFGLKKEKQQMMDTVISSALHNSNIIKASTRYSMLQNRKEDLYQTIGEVGNRDFGVVGIRYYAKDGSILFSTDSTEVGHQVDMQAEACVVCHRITVPPPVVEDRDRIRIYRAPEGNRVIGMINPIENEPECYNAACHGHSSNEKILGVLDVRMSLEEVDRRMVVMTITAWLVVGVVVLLMAIGGGLFIYYYVYRRVQKLVKGTHAVEHGDLNFRFEDDSPDEIGLLARSFNEMTEGLQDAREELKEAYKGVIEVERMNSLGKLSATISHELNNPLAGILTYLKLINKRVAKEGELSHESAMSLLKELETIISETKRCGDIVKDLASFAPSDDLTIEKFQASVAIKTALKVLKHQLPTEGIEERYQEFPGDDDMMEGDYRLIEQVFLNIFINAVEAMDKGGQLQVTLDNTEEDWVIVEVKDTGPGIPADKLKDIFKPFYSSKRGKHSAGLGLAVVYGIVQRHGGTIDVKSWPGVGTSVSVTLPRTIDRDKFNASAMLTPSTVPDKDEI